MFDVDHSLIPSDEPSRISGRIHYRAEVAEVQKMNEAEGAACVDSLSYHRHRCCYLFCFICLVKWSFNPMDMICLFGRFKQYPGSRDQLQIRLHKDDPSGATPRIDLSAAKLYSFDF